VQVVLSSSEWIIHSPHLYLTSLSIDSPALEIDINASAYR
jgi:hypothetical protein